MTSSVLGVVLCVHAALVIVHLNVFAPIPKLVSPDVLEVGVVMVPVPDTRDHTPVPVVGLFHARVAIWLLHCFWSEPAAEVVGAVPCVIITASELVHPPFVIVQVKVAFTNNPVIPFVLEVPGAVTVPVPAVLVQSPVSPPPGAFPARVAVVAPQTFWSVPAFATVAIALGLITSTVELPVAQNPEVADTAQ